MTFGFAARAEASCRIEGDPEAIAGAVEQTLSRLGWPHRRSGKGAWRANVKLNWLSWGEKVEIGLSAEGILRIRSQCSWPLQCFDWGKNRRNVTQFLEDIQASFPSSLA